MGRGKTSKIGNSNSASNENKFKLGDEIGNETIIAVGDNGIFQLRPTKDVDEDAFSGGGDSFNDRFLDADQLRELQRKTAAQRNSTTAINKSYEQVSRETDTLTNYPNGTQIEVYENGSWVTYTAHDPWYAGRNGRMLQRRRYSIVGAGNKNMPVSLSSTSDPYNIAQKQWRKKR